MTEAEWLASTEPPAMLKFFHGGIAALVDDLPTQAQREMLRAFLQTAVTRKLLLFACWCCRRVWSELVNERSRNAVEVTERFADGCADHSQLWKANTDAIQARNAIRRNHVRRIAAHAAYAASGHEISQTASESADVAVWIQLHPSLAEAQTEQARVLRCIFGNPFRPVTLDPRWLTSTVVDLARGIYDERAFDRMPILADALQDAGCDNEDVLSHCRDAGPHARGCWVVDLVLGKS